MNSKYIIIIGLILIIFFLAYKNENFSVCDDIKQNCGLITIPQTMYSPLSGRTIESQNIKINSSRDDCLSCSTCGICTNKFKSVCVNGNEEGPLFYSGCDKYEYGTNPPIINIAETPITADLNYSYQDILSEELHQTNTTSNSNSTTNSYTCDKLCQNKPILNEVDSIRCENCPNCGILTYANTDYCINVSNDDYNNISQKVYTPINTNSDKFNCISTENNAVLKGFNKNSKYEVCLQLEP